MLESGLDRLGRYQGGAAQTDLVLSEPTEERAERDFEGSDCEDHEGFSGALEHDRPR
jgi:hypothetical protein